MAAAVSAVQPRFGAVAARAAGAAKQDQESCTGTSEFSGWSKSQEIRHIPPVHHAEGTVTLPGSKSLSNRVLLLASLAKGKCVVQNVLDSDDVRHMVAALSQLGVTLEPDWQSACITVHGSNGSFKAGGSSSSDATQLNLGNAGTAMRPLCAAVAAAGHGWYMLDGVERMRERPIQGLVDALAQLGSGAECLHNTGCPPVQIYAHGLKGGRVDVDGRTSSQYITALLMASPFAHADVDINVTNGLISKPYVDMTAQLMQRFGADVVVADESHERWHVRPGAYAAPAKAFVEGDASSASYFLGLAAVGGGRVQVHGCGEDSLQGDVRFADVLRKMGCTVHWEASSIEVASPADGILHGVDEDCGDIPDAAMTLAVLALFAHSPTVIRNVASWRVKETERMLAMKREIAKLGGTLEELSEGKCMIHPPATLQFATIDTYDDHRMAMAFSLAAAGCADGVAIRDPACVAKTFPSFFDALHSVSSM